MKIVRYTFITLALILIAYNATKLNFNQLFEAESMVAVICILAAMCVILLMVILNISFRIKEKKNSR